MISTIFDDNSELSADDIFSDKKITVEKDPKRSGLESMEDDVFIKYAEKSHALVSHIREIGLPAKGEQYRVVTRRSFNAIEFLTHICETTNILDLKLAVYSINFNAAKLLIQMIDEGKIHRAEILMSNLRNGAHREKEIVLKKLLVAHKRIQLFYRSSHAKVFSCKTSDGDYFTIEGSGNLANNSRIEQYVIDNDKSLYDFTCDWFERIKRYLKDKKELVIT